MLFGLSDSLAACSFSVTIERLPAELFKLINNVPKAFNLVNNVRKAQRAGPIDQATLLHVAGARGGKARGYLSQERPLGKDPGVGHLRDFRK